MTLQARELAIGYGRTRVADAINLDIRHAEVICLLGPNGCGKTTLFKTLMGLIPALSGTVSFAGTPLAALSARALATRIAWVPQQHAPSFPFRVFDVVMMGRQARKGLFSAPDRADRQRVDAVLDQLGLRDLAPADYSRLSGGQRQMVMIARALAQDTKMLVLDEPTASLDYGNQVRIISEIARLARRGYGIVLSTHNPDHAFAIADRVTLMHDGRIAARGRPEEVLVAERLSAVYGVAISVRRFDSAPTVCVPQYESG